MQVSRELLQEQRLGRLSLPKDNTRPQNNGMLKVQLLDGILNTYLHLAVRHVPAQQTPRSRTGDEDVGLHADLLRGLGVLDAQVVIDLPLVLDPANCTPGGAHGVQDGGELGAEIGDHAGPF